MTTPAPKAKPAPHPSSVHTPEVSRPSRCCGWQRTKDGEYNRNNSAVIAWLPGGRRLRK